MGEGEEKAIGEGGASEEKATTPEEKSIEEKTQVEEKTEVPKEPESTPIEEKPTVIESKEVERKEGPSFGSRIKNWLIILLLIVIIVSIGTIYVWRSGVSDLKSDNYVLIVVQEKGVAKAGSIYDLTADSADIINVEELPAVTNPNTFYQEASKARKIDRLVIVRVETITEVSTEPSLEYNGKKIPMRDVGGYITGALWDANLAGGDPPWMFRANLLSEWVEAHSDKILNANYGSKVYKVFFKDYRRGSIIIYPRNNALLILKYIPIEQILL
jgi:hypothetical protein